MIFRTVSHQHFILPVTTHDSSVDRVFISASRTKGSTQSQEKLNRETQPWPYTYQGLAGRHLNSSHCSGVLLVLMVFMTAQRARTRVMAVAAWARRHVQTSLAPCDRTAAVTVTSHAWPPPLLLCPRGAKVIFPAKVRGRLALSVWLSGRALAWSRVRRLPSTLTVTSGKSLIRATLFMCVRTLILLARGYLSRSHWSWTVDSAYKKATNTTRSIGARSRRYVSRLVGLEASTRLRG